MAHEYVKENDTFNINRNGTVPKPTQAEVTAGKVLKADGTWGEGGGGGGSSTLAGLTDVELSSPSAGQILKYDAENDKWVNNDESGGTVTDVNVNGDSVVDSNGEAQIVSYKEVTQAEYNALPASKTSDGILYCIKDVGGADSFPPLIYSDEEREVGVWRDGKPLYERVVDLGTLPNTTTKTIEIPNIYPDQVPYIRGLAKRYLNNCWTHFVLPHTWTDVTAQIAIYADVFDNDTSLYIRVVTGSDRTNLTGKAIVRYTKTTDTAGSGTWTTQGGYAHHYSTTEHIIGTWIDGKLIYEKVFSIPSLPNTTITEYDTSINNFGNWIDGECNGCVIFPSGNKSPLPYLNLTDMLQTSIKLQYNANGKIQITTGMDRSNVSARFILRYTKIID